MGNVLLAKDNLLAGPEAALQNKISHGRRIANGSGQPPETWIGEVGNKKVTSKRDVKYQRLGHKDGTERQVFPAIDNRCQ
jgi:hypothetical protein